MFPWILQILLFFRLVRAKPNRVQKKTLAHWQDKQHIQSTSKPANRTMKISDRCT